jgi:NAD+ synthase
MSTLYAVSQSCNGRVANTCNLSEDWVGYTTRWGDSVGDFAPIQDLTVSELKAVGYELAHLLPKHLVDRIPTDDLCGKTDEDNLGFTYDVLDKYIRTGICENDNTKKLIDSKHSKNAFKMRPIPKFSLT